VCCDSLRSSTGNWKSRSSRRLGASTREHGKGEGKKKADARNRRELRSFWRWSKAPSPWSPQATRRISVIELLEAGSSKAREAEESGDKDSEFFQFLQAYRRADSEAEAALVLKLQIHGQKPLLLCQNLAQCHVLAVS